MKNSFYCTTWKIHHSSIVMKVLCIAQTLSLECFQILKLHTNVSHIVICIVKLAPKANIWICSVTEITPWRRSQNGLKEKYNRYVKVFYHNTHIFFVSPLRAKTYWNMICLSYLLSSIQERDGDHSLSILSWALIFMHQYFISTMVFPAIVYY